MYYLVIRCMTLYNRQVLLFPLWQMEGQRLRQSGCLRPSNELMAEAGLKTETSSLLAIELNQLLNISHKISSIVVQPVFQPSDPSYSFFKNPVRLILLCSSWVVTKTQMYEYDCLNCAMSSLKAQVCISIDSLFKNKNASVDQWSQTFQHCLE